MGVCLLQKIALNDDEETGKAMLMILGEVEFELKKQANGMLMMRRRLNNKKKLDGNIFTGTFSDLQSTQLFTLTIFIFLLALVGVFYPYNRGALFTALVVIYALTSGIAGYTATSFYC
ncbi:hypothetical protein RND81_01G071500 [Saponaria officinalis]